MVTRHSKAKSHGETRKGGSKKDRVDEQESVKLQYLGVVRPKDQKNWN